MSVINSHSRSRLVILTLAGVLCLRGPSSTAAAAQMPYAGQSLNQTVWAADSGGQEDGLPFKNPEQVLIAYPANEYSTTSANVSILGACDYNYPLYLDGEEIETTRYGFFTVYVPLEVGKNTFTFENNGRQKTLTVIRTKPASSSGSGSSSSSKNTYKEYTDEVWGSININYAMPRSKTSAADVSLLPLTKGTTFRILGEDGSYYRIADGTYVSKSSVTLQDEPLPDNRVTAARVEEDTNNLVTAVLTMNVNALYAVEQTEASVSLTLYDTVSGAAPGISANNLVKSVSVQTDQNAGTTTYTFFFYENALLCGYDVFFRDGAMRFEMKQAPKLDGEDSLEGAVVLLDAGHGDQDNGTAGPLGTYGPVEKDINLAITLAARDYLESRGAEVVLVREDDSFLSLSERVNLIRTVKPDISISIHGNALAVTSDFSKSSGYLTYYSYDYFNDAPDYINEQVSEAMGFSIRSPRQSNLSLTRLTACPAVLLETSFLSNPADYELLIQPDYQKAFGEAIGKAAEAYLTEYAQPSYLLYTVKRGDTLSAISRNTGVSIRVIADYNHIENINHIVAGQTLRIPVEA